MSVATTTTFDAVQEAFVTAAQANVAQGVTVARLWPGPDSTHQMVFMTDVDWIEVTDANIKAGRRHRDEIYNANFEVWNLKPSRHRTDSADAIAEAKAIYDACEEVVAQADSTVRGVAGVTNATCKLVRYEPVTIENAWGVVITARLSVTARLN